MIKNKIFSLVCFLFILFILTGCNKEKEKKLFVGISPDYPPFAFEYNREFIGFDVELTNAISSRLGYKVEFKKMKFEDLFLALENKKVDLIVSAISKTDEREEKFDFSHSYYSPKFALIYKRENSKKVRSIDDIEGKIGVEKGTTMENDIKYHFENYQNNALNDFENDELFKDEGKNKDVKRASINFVKLIFFDEKQKNDINFEEKNEDIKEDINKNDEMVDESEEDLKFYPIKFYNSHSDLLKGLEKDEVMAIFTEVLQAEVVTQNDRDLTFIPISELDDHQHEYHYGFVFNKNSKLTEKFNKIIDEMESEGKIDILKLRWFSGYGVYNDFGKK